MAGAALGELREWVIRFWGASELVRWSTPVRGSTLVCWVMLVQIDGGAGALADAASGEDTAGLIQGC